MTNRGSRPNRVNYDEVRNRALRDPSYRDGLRDAANIARAQGVDPAEPCCPAGMVAVYLDELSWGRTP